jgi:transposase InsO family protein
MKGKRYTTEDKIRILRQADSGQTIYIEPASPWQNGFVESFHGRFRDECLNREQLWTLTEARIVIEDFLRDYNHHRPHSKLGYPSPTPFATAQLSSSSAPVALRAPYAKDGQTNTTNLNTKNKRSISTPRGAN